MFRLISLVVLALAPALAFGDCESKKRTEFSFFLDLNNSPNELTAAKKRAAEECLGFKHIKSKAELESELGKVYRQKEGKVPLMVLSGHSVNSRFSGDRFSLGFHDIEKLKKKYPRFGTDLDSVFLWGCFTGNAKKLSRWHEVFPNASSVIGFTGRSPLDSQLVGAEFLDSFWPQREQIHQGGTDAEIRERLVNILPGGRGGASYVTAGLSFDSCDENGNATPYMFFVDNIDTSKFKLVKAADVKDTCGQAKEELPGLVKELERYWSGQQEPYASGSPMYTNRQVNTLRYALYPWFNQFEHCLDEGVKLKDGSEVGLNEMVNLIFYGNIKSNFTGKLGGKVREAQKILSKAGVSVPALGRINEASRAELVAASETLRSPETLEKAKKQGPASVKKLEEFGSLFHNVVVRMDARCADITWINHNPGSATAPPALCNKPL